ncbi:hypothetical protein PK35_12975 [Tamlana nanhaiensis]|uniref:Transposase n=1 Tax=Neotamlana nanhaiensis TaxID=1382798 RepID=A0A0D7VXZ1_9FLAO|nr:hypothetical protein [Tamlana nanhaiensis]KJD31669.1 hypothetical protein PK35_12975 [Tamlana nanhaiensis]
MKNLQCKFFGHHYQVSRDVTYHVKEYRCKYCKKELTTNSNGYLVELTPIYREINDVLASMFVKRHGQIPATTSISTPPLVVGDLITI